LAAVVAASLAAAVAAPAGCSAAPAADRSGVVPGCPVAELVCSAAESACRAAVLVCSVTAAQAPDSVAVLVPESAQEQEWAPALAFHRGQFPAAGSVSRGRLRVPADRAPGD
jgi:hypothetical protein